MKERNSFLLPSIRLLVQSVWMMNRYLSAETTHHALQWKARQMTLFPFTWAQCDKTFYAHNLKMFVIS
jgi:hypothetical protein